MRDRRATEDNARAWLDRVVREIERSEAASRRDLLGRGWKFVEMPPGLEPVRVASAETTRAYLTPFDGNLDREMQAVYSVEKHEYLRFAEQWTTRFPAEIAGRLVAAGRARGFDLHVAPGPRGIKAAEARNCVALYGGSTRGRVSDLLREGRRWRPVLVHLNALATLAVVPRLRTVYHPGPAGTFLYTAAFAQIGPAAAEERAAERAAKERARAVFRYPPE